MTRTFTIKDGQAPTQEQLDEVKAAVTIFAALLNGAHCQHDMGVGVAAACVVDGKVGAHSRIDKLRFYILADKRNALLPCQFTGQGNFQR